jgi:hypothetical protein
MEMAKKINRGAIILTTVLLGLSLVVLGVLANTDAAHAADEDCLLLVLDSADGAVLTAGITIRLVDRSGESHSYLTDDNGMLEVPCGLLGSGLLFADSHGEGYCIVLDPAGDIIGERSSLRLEDPALQIMDAPQSSRTELGSILRLCIGPGSAEPTDN